MKGEELNKIKEILNKNELEKKINKIKNICASVKKKEELEKKLKQEQELINKKVKEYKTTLQKNLINIKNEIQTLNQDQEQLFDLLSESSYFKEDTFSIHYYSKNKQDSTFTYLKNRLEEMSACKLSVLILDTRIIDVYEMYKDYEEYEDYSYRRYCLLVPEKIKDIVTEYEKEYTKNTINKLLKTKNVYKLNVDLVDIPFTLEKWNERELQGLNPKKELCFTINSDAIKNIDVNLYWEVLEQYLVNKAKEENQSKIERLKNEYSAHKKQIEEIENTLNELEK